MQSPTNSGPKIVNGLTYLLGSSLTTASLLMLVGCGSKKENKPPAPCAAGINATTCSVDLVERSVWTKAFESHQTDEKTKQRIPGSQRRLKAFYEFAPLKEQSVWRRSLLIESQAGNTAMFQEGRIVEITAKTITLQLSKSSCMDASPVRLDEPSLITLYYERNGSSLQLDNQPIVKRKARGLGDIFGNVFADAITSMLREVLEAAFSFDGAGRYLTSGRGTFQSEKVYVAQELAAKGAELGCFSSFGSGFSKSAQKPAWD